MVKVQEEKHMPILKLGVMTIKILLLWHPEAKVTPCPLVCDNGQVIGVVGITKVVEEDAVPHQGVHQGKAHIGQQESAAQRLSVVTSLVAELQGSLTFCQLGVTKDKFMAARDSIHVL